jgi:hypothetical protein
VDSDVTGRAILIPWVGHVVRRGLGRDAVALPPEVTAAIVALETEREDRGPFEEARIHRPVRVMATFATIDADGRVLVDKRSAFFAVASQARRIAVGGRLHHARADAHAPGGGRGAVRVMAIGASHHTFVDPMFKRHRELRTNAAVASVTEIGLAFGEQELGSLRPVD